MLLRKLKHGGGGYGDLDQPLAVRELDHRELTYKEKSMLGGFELGVRQEFFRRIHDSPLGIRLAKEVSARMGFYSHDPDKVVALSKVANNATIESIEVLPMELAHSHLRSLTDPYIMDENGVLCVEASMLAEVAEHLVYSWSDGKPDFTGYTQEVLLRTRSIEGTLGHHMVLRTTFFKGDIAEVRFSDPINGPEGTWGDLLNGEAYADFESRPTDIIGFSEPINFLWYPTPS